jgi:uncharacterized protein YcnI
MMYLASKFRSMPMSFRSKSLPLFLGTVFAASIAFAPLASAHVTVAPRESRAGAHEKYTVRVPTEGKVATASVELQLPDSVSFVAVAAPAGHTYELKQTNGKVTSIVWKMKIDVNEFAEFSFMARNPKEGKELVWKAVQRFADGTSTEWAGPAGDKRPASVTKLNAAESGHTH